VTEIKNTLAILKARWPEVAVIIGLPLLSRFVRILHGYFTVKGFLTPCMFNRLLIPITILFPIVLTVLRCGFLRTAYLEGPKRHSPLVLFRVGIHFLWRMIVLGALYGIPFFALILFGHHFIVRQVSPESLSQITLSIYQLCFVAANMILVKLILLIPALIIVLDCRVFESFRFLKFCKLSKARTLVILYFINIAIGFFPSILSQYCWSISCGTTCCSTTSASQYILRVVFSVVTNIIRLMIAVMAVRFVGQSLWTFKTSTNFKSGEMPTQA